MENSNYPEGEEEKRKLVTDSNRAEEIRKCSQGIRELSRHTVSTDLGRYIKQEAEAGTSNSVGEWSDGVQKRWTEVARWSGQVVGWAESVVIWQEAEEKEICEYLGYQSST